MTDRDIQRDRLIDLFKKTEYTPFPEMTIKSNLGNQFTDYALNCIVDKLLANGVIVPPCKVGDTVYSLMECTCEDIDGVHTPCEYYTEIAEKMCSHPKGDCPYEYRIAECIVTDMNLLHFTKKWGKTVFLTKEEAEAKLGELNNGTL